MRITILLSLLFCILAAQVSAQMLDDRNLYDIWIAAEKHMDAGRFENAIILLEGRPNVPEFQAKLKTAKRLQAIFQSGERSFKSRRYSEALAMFSKYRSVEKELYVAIFDKRIETCLQELQKINVRRLDEATRVISGFEWAYKGDKQLSVLDTTEARKSFTKARQLGGALNATLREQYQEGLAAVRSLRVWGEKYNRSLTSNDSEKTLELLKSYRSASKYIIGSLESEIRKMEEKSTLAPRARVIDLASKCQINDLSYFIRANKQVLPNAAEMTERLNEYIQIEKDISSFKKDPGNNEFVRSAYRNLIYKGAQIPEIGSMIQACAQKEFYEYLIDLVRINEKAGDENNVKSRYHEAIKVLVEAKQQGIPGTESYLNQIQGRLAAKLGCEGIRVDFEKSVANAQRELSNCRIIQAKRAWEEGLAKLVGCDLNNASYLDQYISLSSSIASFYIADSLYSSLNAQAQKAMDGKRCEEAKELYQKMASLDVCNVAFRDSASAKNILRVIECERSSCFSTMNTRASQSLDSKNWKQAYDFYKAAFECATSAQKERISQILADIECDAYPENCKKKGVSFSLEPTLRVMTNKPKYTEEGFFKETSFGYFSSGGLQLSFLSYDTPFDFTIGVEYFRTQYQSLRTIQGVEYASAEFDVSGANAHAALKIHKVNPDPNKIRPYVKGGLEVLIPTVYHMRDLDNSSRSTNDKSFLKSQSLSVFGGAGVEMQRKRFGFFIEATAGYNFSGIYNSNAVSASGSKGVTEAYFRMAGLRVGIRLW